MEPITFITGNAAKAQFISDYLKRPLEHHKLDLAEIQSLDLEEVVIDKVKRAYNILKKPVLVEDGSLELEGLRNLPGPLAKWFYEILGNEGLAKLVNGLSSKKAVTRCMFALYDGDEMQIFHGEMKGSIADEPRGESGFGFDPIFINEGYSQTRGEMNKEDWVKTSMRTMALAKMHEYFENNKN